MHKKVPGPFYNQFKKFLRPAGLLWVLLILVVLSTGCNKLVLLDNPSAAPLLVSLNEANYVVNADTGIYVSVPIGTCKLAISTPEGIPTYETELEIREPGLVNLTRINYVIEEELYVDHRENRTDFLAQLSHSNEININGNTLTGPFEFHPSTEIFIPQTWNFDALTSLPDQISLAQFTSFSVKRKIWREADFWDDYQQRMAEAEEPVEGETPTPLPPSNTIPVDSTPPTVVPAPADTSQPDSLSATDTLEVNLDSES